MSFLYVFLNVVYTVYELIVSKRQLFKATAFCQNCSPFPLLLNPRIFIAFVVTVLVSVFGMGAMTNLQLSPAYPFTRLAPVLPLMWSDLFFHEPIKLPPICCCGNSLGMINRG